MADVRSPSEPRVFPSSGWDNINTSLPVEEESIPTYRPANFYPVHIGEVFNHRYQVVGKLGYGSRAPNPHFITCQGPLLYSIENLHSSNNNNNPRDRNLQSFKNDPVQPRGSVVPATVD